MSYVSPFYKGQVVMVRPELNVNTPHMDDYENSRHQGWDGRHMSQFAGKVGIIKEYHERGYKHRLTTDSGSWQWCDEWLMPVAETEEELMLFAIKSGMSDEHVQLALQHVRERGQS